ncbi:MAG: hypothetical protein N4A54_09945 [Peptostreptococcaceae bacterium]|nr:hypothetical protein [Peptostreptococcaceae bacterium]
MKYLGSKKNKKIDYKNSLEFICNIDDIDSDMIILNDYTKFVMGLKIQGTNNEILTENEILLNQEMMIEFMGSLESNIMMLDYPIENKNAYQIAKIENYIKKNKKSKEKLDPYDLKMREKISIINRKIYIFENILKELKYELKNSKKKIYESFIFVEYDIKNENLKKDDYLNKAKLKLTAEINSIKNFFSSRKLITTNLNTIKLEEIYFKLLNPIKSKDLNYIKHKELKDKKIILR